MAEEEGSYPQTKEWLIAELTRREIDVDAYGEYLMSFLTPEASPNEVVPEIIDVLGAVVPEDVAKELGEALVSKWEEEVKDACTKSSTENAKSEKAGKDLESAILKVIEEEDEKIAQAAKEIEAEKKEEGGGDNDEEERGKRELTPEEKAMKAKILAEYGGTAVDIDLSDKPDKAYVNPNTAIVANEKQKLREQQKAAHDAKQQEIKKSQENQKKTREEKKAKRRAACQKGERRR